MDKNDIIDGKLVNLINKIEVKEAKIQREKDKALVEIRKQIPKNTFEQMLDKISEEGYGNERLTVEEIKEKEANKQKLEYDDYITVLKMYDNIAPKINKQ